jgi:hypothetical protein
MNEATLGILLTMEDQATPKMKSFGATLSTNRMAIRELAMGVTYLGATLLGLGIALEKSNSPLAQSVGHMFMMVGGIAAAVGSSIQFISAIAKMVDALKKLQIMQMITQALAGPAGWVTLGVGVAVAGAVVGATMYERSQKGASQTNVHVTVQGSVIKEKDLAESVRRQVVLTQQRNYNTSGVK